MTSPRQTSADLIDGDAELACHLAIHVDLNGRVIERLTELQVAQRGIVANSLAHLRRKGTRRREVWPHDGHLDGGGGAEVHDAADDVARLERELRLGEPGVEGVPQPVLEAREDRGARWRSATCSTPSWDPPVHKKMVLIG